MLRVTAWWWAWLGLQPIADARPATAPPEAHGSPVLEAGIDPGLAAFARDRTTPGRLWIGKLASNGGREVVIYVPQPPRADRPTRLVFHFHGTYSEHVERPRPGLPKARSVGWTRLAQTLDAIDELHATRPYDVVLVYPRSAGRRLEPEHPGSHTVQYDRMWMRAESFERLREEALAIAAEHHGVALERVDDRAIVEGHSAGGIALRNVARSSPRGVGTYLFLDASFQGWADGCYRAVRAAGSPAQVVLVVTQDGMADGVGRWKPWCAELERDAAAASAPPCAAATPSPADARRCEALREQARAWDESREWCAGLRSDLRGWPGVAVHRTRVRHGDQPRTFAGGLGLPAALQP